MKVAYDLDMGIFSQFIPFQYAEGELAGQALAVKCPLRFPTYLCRRPVCLTQCAVS